MAVGKDGSMLLKWIGGFCSIIGCGSVGFRIAANQKREEYYLGMLDRLLDNMMCELQYRMTPLPDLCKKVSENANGGLKKVFSILAQELEDQVSPDVNSCMKVTLEMVVGLPALTKNCLQTLGQNLGRFDLYGQINEIEAVKRECAEHLKHLQNNKEERLRSYQTLGLCAGAGLAILFI